MKDFDLEKAYEACRRGIMEKTLAPWSGKFAGKLDEFYKNTVIFPLCLKMKRKQSLKSIHLRSGSRWP